MHPHRCSSPQAPVYCAPKFLITACVPCEVWPSSPPSSPPTQSLPSSPPSESPRIHRYRYICAKPTNLVPSAVFPPGNTELYFPHSPVILDGRECACPNYVSNNSPKGPCRLNAWGERRSQRPMRNSGPPPGAVPRSLRPRGGHHRLRADFSCHRAAPLPPRATPRPSP